MLRNARIDVKCPKCGRKLRKTLGDVARGFLCPNCSTKFIGDDKGVRDAERALDKFKRDIKRIFR